MSEIEVIRPRCLIVDDNPDMAEVIAEVVRDHGMLPVIATDAESCIQYATSGPIVGAFIDLVMPGQDGIELVGKMAENDVNAPIVLMSGYHDSYLRMAAELADTAGLSVIGAIRKPFDLDHVSLLINGMVEAAA